jgi:hypothetical protein
MDEVADRHGIPFTVQPEYRQQDELFDFAEER